MKSTRPQECTPRGGYLGVEGGWLLDGDHQGGDSGIWRAVILAERGARDGGGAEGVDGGPRRQGGWLSRTPRASGRADKRNGRDAGGEERGMRSDRMALVPRLG